jgi:hypothetical protein
VHLFALTAVQPDEEEDDNTDDNDDDRDDESKNGGSDRATNVELLAKSDRGKLFFITDEYLTAITLAGVRRTTLLRSVDALPTNVHKL